jgi:transcriptional regulator
MTLYIPGQFAQNDPQKALALMRANPFATLITPTAQDLLISHVPILARVDDEGVIVLHFHVARANPHASALASHAATTAVFCGAHGYISPTWYESRNAVPTWNYAAVHASGTPMPCDDSATLDDLSALSAAFERGADPWTMADMSDHLRATLPHGLRAFRIVAPRIESKQKLSQNRAAADRAGVIAGLRATGLAHNQELAALMETL